MKFEYDQEDYEHLNSAFTEAKNVCAPDEYQMRQNRLAQEVAIFLLRPYWHEKNEKRKEENDSSKE